MKPCLVILGTAAAIPSLYRFAPSIAIVGMKEVALLDVGEGAQLRLQEAGISLSRVRIIAITHLHGDHVLGLFPLLQSMWMQFRNDNSLNVVVLSPEETLCELLSSSTSIECITVSEGKPYQSREFVVTPVKVNHGDVTSFGYHIKVSVDPKKQKYVKVFYSGDGVCGSECLELLLSVGVDVVVHDATFISVDIDKARASGHATALDAAILAQKLGAKILILTHISARYGRISHDVVWDAKRFFKQCVVAEDLMYVPLAPYAN